MTVPPPPYGNDSDPYQRPDHDPNNESEWNQQPPPLQGPDRTGGYGYSYGPPPPPPPKKLPGWLIPAIITAAVLILLCTIGTFFAAKAVIDNSDPDPTPTATVTTMPSGSGPTSPRAGANDTQFLAALSLPDSQGNDHGKYWASRVKGQRGDVLKLGYSICGAYDQGASPQEIVTEMTSVGIPDIEANWVRAVAVVTLCPEHKAANAGG